MFEHIPVYPGDPILSLFQDFQRDPEARKVNLSIGLYYDEAGKVPVLPSVRGAASRLAEQGTAHTYLPMEGSAGYCQALQQLIFGADSAALRERRIATLQTVGGSGAIRLGADLLKRYFPDSAIWVSDPSWDNQGVLFSAAGLEVHTYPYYDPLTNGIRFDEMIATLSGLAAGSIVLLQPCCHNPTGIDPSREQWLAITELCAKRGLIPFLDMAYQGFGDELADDAWPIRAMTDAGLSLFVSNSFSKNFSLYGERCGGLSVVCPNQNEAARVFGQAQANVRRMYSSPPLYGSQLISTVLNDAVLATQWVADVAAMRERIKRMRAALKTRLDTLVPGMSFDYLVTQRGMFSYTGLAPNEVGALRERRGVYLLRSGRACMAGLNDANVDYVADSIGEVLKARVNRYQPTRRISNA
ncbi:aspartate/tyrosine/aromatic aminotransferase [Paraburkholderia sp. UYCP14C]|uniref:amino acid aminotransferase n=1 Tax=Paraburkholderia sp. UYCP14C TaxID=2511130 RepID=UPI0010220244|nr:amino acid aminotransferase [Paraburkholderia sp. UYCP14C]RZF31648.1 aspartate/tyrosine/aromatic aminotransferase [Paraburkholderia sp. UYCP14C]